MASKICRYYNEKCYKPTSSDKYGQNTFCKDHGKEVYENFIKGSNNFYIKCSKHLDESGNIQCFNSIKINIEDSKLLEQLKVNRNGKEFISFSMLPFYCDEHLTRETQKIKNIKSNVGNKNNLKPFQKIFSSEMFETPKLIICEKGKDEDEDELCGCCMIYKRDMVGVNCGHLYFCEHCLDKNISNGMTQSKLCPICRVETSFIKVLKT